MCQPRASSQRLMRTLLRRTWPHRRSMPRATALRWSMSSSALPRPLSWQSSAIAIAKSAVPGVVLAPDPARLGHQARAGRLFDLAHEREVVDVVDFGQVAQHGVGQVGDAGMEPVAARRRRHRLHERAVHRCVRRKDRAHEHRTPVPQPDLVDQFRRVVPRRAHAPLEVFDRRGFGEIRVDPQRDAAHRRLARPAWRLREQAAHRRAAQLLDPRVGLRLEHCRRRRHGCGVRSRAAGVRLGCPWRSSLIRGAMVAARRIDRMSAVQRCVTGAIQRAAARLNRYSVGRNPSIDR